MSSNTEIQKKRKKIDKKLILCDRYAKHAIHETNVQAHHKPERSCGAVFADECEGIPEELFYEGYATSDGNWCEVVKMGEKYVNLIMMEPSTVNSLFEYQARALAMNGKFNTTKVVK